MSEREDDGDGSRTHGDDVDGDESNDAADGRHDDIGESAIDDGDDSNDEDYDNND